MKQCQKYLVTQDYSHFHIILSGCLNKFTTPIPYQIIDVNKTLNVGSMEFVVVHFLNCVPTSKEIQHPRYTVAEHILSQHNRIEFTITTEQSTFL